MIILGTNSVKTAGGFNVDNSVRLNTADDPSMAVTQGTPTNVDKYTFSVWVKRADVGIANSKIFSVTSGSSTGEEKLEFNADDLIWRQTDTSGNINWQRVTDRVFRDSSAWYNIVVAYDSTDGTAGNRCKMYINGVQETSFSASPNPASGANSYTNTSGRSLKFFALHSSLNTQNAGAYFSEMVYVDGLQLDATSFGEFDEDSGIWKPINVSGLTFGDNGFYCEYKNSGALGADTSGNSNNLSVTNIAAIDQSTDTCTNNFATMNSLDNFYQGATFSDGNLTVTTTNSSQSYSTSSIMVSSGKWYVECKPVSGGSEPEIGVAYKMVGVANGNNAQLSYNANGYGYRASNPGTVWYNGSAVSTSFSQYANGDIIGIALDLDNNKLYFRKNNEAWGNSGNPESGATGTGAISIVDPASTDMGAYAFAMNENFNDQNKVFSWNFGSPPFAISSSNTDGDGFGNFEYAVPSGYFALCTKNLAEYG